MFSRLAYCWLCAPGSFLAGPREPNAQACKQALSRCAISLVPYINFNSRCMRNNRKTSFQLLYETDCDNAVIIMIIKVYIMILEYFY